MMNTKIIKVKSRPSFNLYCVEQKWFVSEDIPSTVKIIEILDDEINSDNHKPYFSKSNNNILMLSFSDVERDFNDEIQAMSDGQAQLLYDFIVRDDVDEIDKYVIHCHAGISRSGAIGLFICDYLKSLNIKHKFGERNKINPNGLVSRLLNNKLSGYDK